MTMEGNHRQDIVIESVLPETGQFKFGLVGVHCRIELFYQKVIKRNLNNIRDEAGVSGFLPAIGNRLN